MLNYPVQSSERNQKIIFINGNGILFTTNRRKINWSYNDHKIAFTNKL